MDVDVVVEFAAYPRGEAFMHSRQWLVRGQESGQPCDADCSACKCKGMIQSVED